jgi:hypothetical protein
VSELNPATQAATAANLETTRDQVVMNVINGLASTVDLDAADKIRQHVIFHVKATIKILATRIQTPITTMQGMNAVASPQATYMSDNSSTSVDTWMSSSGMYGSGTIIGSASIHRYAVELRLTSPKGRVATATGNYLPGTVSSTAFPPIDMTDLSDYTISTTNHGYCTQAWVYFIIAFLSVTGTFLLHETYYKQCYKGLVGCNCDALACTSGTPTCFIGVGLSLVSGDCPEVMHASYLVYTTYLSRRAYFLSTVGRMMVLDRVLEVGSSEPGAD